MCVCVCVCELGVRVSAARRLRCRTVPDVGLVVADAAPVDDLDALVERLQHHLLVFGLELTVRKHPEKQKRLCLAARVFFPRT